ncbi:MAG: adenylyl-sulfate reductase subunit alpha [Candidatus Melainabacteria bacterium]|nr:adenylyl-sulfate reductase subunit alpha [Candidatus Melainabacteria bacterium]
MQNLIDKIKIEKLKTDFLIIGAGAAGCFAAYEAKRLNPNIDILILEKAHIARSGCLAAGVNAINAYITPGQSPESFLEYVKKDSMDLIREDLVYSIAKEVNNVVNLLEEWGLPIPKDENGQPYVRGRGSIIVQGERVKPIIAQATKNTKAKILNRVVVTNLIKNKNKVCGAFGFGVRDGKFYVIQAKAVLVATGGASGIYKPNNEGEAKHKIWYSPFNTGAGYAIGIRAGAEMTTFEMRYVSMRIKDLMAPTGAVAQGVKAKQVNALGERYLEERYVYLGGTSMPTAMRLWATLQENIEGRGPCYLDTTHLTREQAERLQAYYLHMTPGLTLYWGARGTKPDTDPPEIVGTEPYIVGGHAQAGYWIDINRMSTLENLYAAGDVAGGAPKKYLSGAAAEGMIAAREIVSKLKSINEEQVYEKDIKDEVKRVFSHLEKKNIEILPDELELRMQKIMDDYAGGISSGYILNEQKLLKARKYIKELKQEANNLYAINPHELMKCHEVIDRLDVASVLIEHLLHRKETRWPIYQSRADYPERDDKNWLKFVNSVYDQTKDEIKILERPCKKLEAVK